jgi:LPPG:FO 2-phospho-L-lactate transferase
MIAVLAGGVGAAKLLLGLSHVMPPEQITIIGNTGDDIELFRLRICPDLDTIVYTLSGRVNPETGWGIGNDTFECLQALGGYGGETWFKLGDRDLATHLWRTYLLGQGLSLTEVTDKICNAAGLRSQLLPMTNSYTPTRILTDMGELHLQEYLVREQCQPRIRGVNYSNVEQAQMPAGMEESILAADAVILAPSNPFISIGPILAVPGMKKALSRTSAPVLAVTPIVGGRALKGPAARMLQELGHPASALGVAQIYRGLAKVFVLDRQDMALKDEIEALGMKVSTTDTVMSNLDDKARLARHLLELL